MTISTQVEGAGINQISRTPGRADDFHGERPTALQKGPESVAAGYFRRETSQKHRWEDTPALLGFRGGERGRRGARHPLSSPGAHSLTDGQASDLQPLATCAGWPRPEERRLALPACLGWAWGRDRF